MKVKANELPVLAATAVVGLTVMVPSPLTAFGRRLKVAVKVVAWLFKLKLQGFVVPVAPTVFALVQLLLVGGPPADRVQFTNVEPDAAVAVSVTTSLLFREGEQAPGHVTSVSDKDP